MVVDWCPHCNQRIVYMPRIGDYVHQCNSGNPTIDNEDIVHFHSTFQNRDGSISQGKGPTEAMWSGVVNNVQGSLAGIEGEDIEDLTVRGNRESTHRTRPREVYKIIPNKNY